MKQVLEDAIKEFCTDAIASGNATFTGSALFGYVQSKVEADVSDIEKAIAELTSTDEVHISVISLEHGIYRAETPHQRQTTAAGETKSKPFTKKQKAAALAAVKPIIEALQHYPKQYQQVHGDAIKRLAEWLDEQVNK